MAKYTYVAVRSSTCRCSDNHFMHVVKGSYINFDKLEFANLVPGNWVYHMIEQTAPEGTKEAILELLDKELRKLWSSSYD